MTPPLCLLRIPACRYIFAFQMPWLPEAAICANDYKFLSAVFTEEPFRVQTPGAFTEAVRLCAKRGLLGQCCLVGGRLVA